MKVTNTQEMREALAKRIAELNLEGKCLSDGAFQSNLVIVAEAPGEREVETGRPLVGGSGSKLWEVLRAFKINRSDAYITNVSKRQVSLGNDKRHPINKHELESWYSILQWELSQLPNARVVLVLGNIALQALLGKSGITSWRGSVIDAVLPDGRPITYVCTFNPAMVLRDPKLEVPFKLDCSKLRRVLDGRWEVIPVRSYLNPTFDEAMDYIQMLEDGDAPVAYDIEVLSNETACIGLANDPNEGMCINFRNLDENRYTLDQERQIRRRFQHFVRSPRVQLVAQNGMFDASWLAYKDRIIVPKHYFDTMLAHHVLYPPLPHTLGFITTQYTTRPFYKDEGKGWREGGDIDQYWHYNVQDACNTHSAHTSMFGELRDQGLDKFFFEHVMRLQPHLVRMTVGGLKLDLQYKAQLAEQLKGDIIELMDKFYDAVHEATGDPDFNPNPNSPKDMSQLFFSKLKLVGKGSSTDVENRKVMFAHPATTEPKREVLRLTDELAREKKFYSTYVTMAEDEDGRMRSTYDQRGVQSAPGRLSSSGVLWGHYDAEQRQFVTHGTNLQNQPERSHNMFICDDGYTMVYFDQAQAEARYVGWSANIISWIEQFERARIDGLYDAHRALASEMFGVPYDEVPTFDRYDPTHRNSKGELDRLVPDDPRLTPGGRFPTAPTIRYIAKRCRHGLNYRMGPDRLSSVTGLSLGVATTAYRTYHRITPELARWWTDVEKEVRDNGRLYNVFGRRWLLMERLSPEALESIIAFKPQSAIGDKVARVIYQAEDDPRWPIDGRIALNNHDSLVGLVPTPKAELCLSIMKKYAEEPLMVPYREKGVIKHRELIIPADCKIAVPNERGYLSWGSMKSIQVEAAR